MTINNYISELRVELPKDYPSIDDRSLLKLMNEFRAVHIKNTLNQNDAYIPVEYSQKILGIELNIVAQKEVPFITDNSRILKSNVKIPDIINLSNKDLVLRVWDSKVLGQDFSYITPQQAKYAGNGKFNNKDIFVFLYDGYLYVKLKRENHNINLLNFISLEAIFENPDDLIEIEYKTYFDFRDYEYPLTTVAWSYIKANILKDGLRIINSTENE